MPKAAFRKAATSAAVVAMTPTRTAPAANPATPQTAKTKPTSWANFSGGTGSRSLTGPRRGATTVANTRPYGCRRGPPRAPMAKTTACRPSTIAAATGLMAETIRTICRTAAVTQAANLGPRTSTRSGWAVVVLLLLDTVRLLLDTPVARKRGRHAHGRIRGCFRVLRGTARLLSSYGNSNNPRCGTDQLRGAW